uniref:Putative bacterial regulatory protein, gntR family protein n=1 Tax=uncultured marine microorganism HF4000_APKG8L7 TaxID=455556 RepID=B3TB84_9ZZZZ|nr:putative bacterial regulatory protein, gntR family protein [uncultured marine microorganism HF4000_APKG8L7]
MGVCIRPYSNPISNQILPMAQSPIGVLREATAIDAAVADALAADAPAADALAGIRATPCAGLDSARIAAALRRSILDGAYAYGDKLPAERALARLFSTSRNTVRRALDRLEESRLIMRRVGSGTFVSHAPGGGEDEISEITSPLELIEVRLALEPDMARLAVINATPRDIERLEEALRRVEGSGPDAERFTRADQGFHQLLAECTHNPLFIWIYRRINAVRGHAQWADMKDKILTAGRIANYNRQHRALFAALRGRNIEGAVAIVTEHLRKARRDLVGAESE